MWNSVKYFITNCSTSRMSVLLSTTRFRVSLWHYSFRSYKICGRRLGPGGFRRKSPIDGATDLLSKIWQHITTVSFESALIVVVVSRKPKNTSGHVKMGSKHNLVHFKSLLWCLLIKSWSSSLHLYDGKNMNGNPISTIPYCFFISYWWSDSYLAGNIDGVTQEFLSYVLLLFYSLNN